MAISTFNENLDIIASLPTCPTSPEYTADEVKGKFDEGAKKIKEYINGTLIPQILDELANTATGDGAYKYIPCKRLLKQYKTAGTYIFDTEEFPSFTGVYDVVLVGGGGGGYNSGEKQGGGGGAVTELIGVDLVGRYTVNVGAGGAVSNGLFPNDGESTYVTNAGDEVDFYEYAAGGQGADGGKTRARGGGVGATDAVPNDGADAYGAGGDSIGYGTGAKGAGIDDSIIHPKGYGGGGWGAVSGGCGTVLIYGYVRQEV
ncbi:MAG: hypothetical protein IKL21_06610 [Clostridia bacterium]|nr:hypothetical protein [Clostridia bacterium]